MKVSSASFGHRLAVIAGACLAMFGSAHASTALLYDDFVVAQDTWRPALDGLGLSTTAVYDDQSFNSTISSSFDLVVVQFDMNLHSISSALGSYIAGGGKVIYGDFRGVNDSLFGVNSISTNAADLQITFPAIVTGLSTAAQHLASPNNTYIVFSRKFDTASQTVLATLGGAAGILLTNGGNVIVNGFLGETITSSADEVRLYQNEVSLVLGAVPEPSSYLMMLLGLGAVGALARSHRG